MRVLLIKPYNLSDHIQPSLGLAYLATQIRNKHDVLIYDCIKERKGPEAMPKIIRQYKPDVVGIQCYTFDQRNVKLISRAVRESDPQIQIVVGGPGISSEPKEIFNHFGKDIDYGFSGEAEIGFPQFLDALEKGNTGLFPFVPGLIYRSNGEVKVNPRHNADDLDSLGFPAWDLVQPQEYPPAQHGAFYEKFPIAPIITTRGCPYSCTFCNAPQLSGRKMRLHSVDYITKQIAMLYHNYGVREFQLVDDNFTMEMDWAKEVLRGIIALNLDISLATPNGIRMDRLDDELLELFKKAGLYLVTVAVESGTNEVLKAMKKATTVEEIRENVALIKKHKFDVAGFFIVGFPGESRETIEATIRFAKELKLTRANFFTYLPLPGTESHRQLVESGEIKDVDWDNFYFMSAPYTPKGMTREELLSLKRRAFLSFHLYPPVLWRNLRAIKSFRHLLFLLRRFYHWILMKPTGQGISLEYDPESTPVS